MNEVESIDAIELRNFEIKIFIDILRLNFFFLKLTSTVNIYDLYVRYYLFLLVFSICDNSQQEMKQERKKRRSYRSVK